MAPKKSLTPVAPSSSSDTNSDQNSSSSDEEQVQIEPKPTTESDSDSDSELPPPVKVHSGKRSASGTSKTPEKKKAKTDKSESSAGLARDESGSNKKVLFQRLWSEEDEFVILKGMSDYKLKKGRDAMSSPDDFLEFINNSLHFAGANKSQIVNKVKRLKKKYENAKKKKITNPSELKAFQLSKLVWGGGDEATVEQNNGVGASHSKPKANNKGKALDVWESKKTEKGSLNWVISACKKDRLIPGTGDGAGFFNEARLKDGMALLEEGERFEMEDKLRRHNVAEMELYLKRVELIQEVTQKTYNAVKAARN